MNKNISSNDYDVIRGTWIPGEASFNPKLNTTDQRIFAIINMLDNKDKKGCFASNAYFCKQLGKTERTIRRSISKLVKYDYISIEIKNNNNRILRINPNYTKKYLYLIKLANNNYPTQDNINGTTQAKVGLPAKVGLHNNIVSSFINIKERNHVFSENRKKRELIPLDDTPSSSKDSIKQSLKHDYEKKNGMVSYDNALNKTRKVINYWNEKGIGVKHSLKSKAIAKAIKVIESEVWSTYSVLDVLSAFDSYKQNNEFVRKISILEFFKGNQYRKGGKVSLFKKFLKMDKEKVVTNELKRLYKKHVIGNDKYKFNVEQHLKFVKASEMLKKYFRQQDIKKYISNSTKKDQALILFKALKDRYKALENIYPGHLCSRSTFDQVLPTFIKKNYATKGRTIEGEGYEWEYED